MADMTIAEPDMAGKTGPGGLIPPGRPAQSPGASELIPSSICSSAVI